MPVDQRVKIKEIEKREKYLDLAGELKINVEHTGDGDINCCLCTWNGLKRIGKGTGTTGDRKKNRDDSDYSIADIGQNTQMSLGDLRRHAATQTSMKANKLTLVWKLASNNNDNKKS